MCLAIFRNCRAQKPVSHLVHAAWISSRDYIINTLTWSVLNLRVSPLWCSSCIGFVLFSLLISSSHFRNLTVKTLLFTFTGFFLFSGVVLIFARVVGVIYLPLVRLYIKSLRVMWMINKTQLCFTKKQSLSDASLFVTVLLFKASSFSSWKKKSHAEENNFGNGNFWRNATTAE